MSSDKVLAEITPHHFRPVDIACCAKHRHFAEGGGVYICENCGHWFRFYAWEMENG